MGDQNITALTGIEGLTTDWLSEALGTAVAAVTVSPVGTGQVADTYRARLTYERSDSGPATVIAKVPSADPTSRGAARMTRTYEIEASFYLDLAATLAVRSPHCYAAAHDLDSDDYVVLLEDVAPAEQGDQLAGCDDADITAAVDELAKLHGSRWGDPTLAELHWLDRAQPENLDNLTALIGACIPIFLDRYRPRLRPETIALVERFAPHLDAYLHRHQPPFSVVHGDYRCDNLLFGADRVVVVDWQTVSLGNPAGDLGYLLGTSLSTPRRRALECDLVARYADGVRAFGVSVDDDWLWTEYCRASFSGIIMAIVASALVRQTDRGDEMFLAMAERPADQVRDLDAESLL